MRLQSLLSKENNNLDIFRVLAACMVIYGHAYAIVPGSGNSDLVYRMLGFDYSGSLAVKIFFFLSGLVVTNSLLTKNNPASFAIARFFRIWPALTITTLITALLLGPLSTKLTLGQYFSAPETWSYVWQNVLMKIQFNLPGVFAELHYPHVLNGSLWTIPHEVCAYIILLALYMLHVFKSRAAASIMFMLIAADPLLSNKILFTWRPVNHEVDLLAPCFAFGSLLAIYKDRIVINAQLVIGSWLIYWLLQQHSINFYIFYFALFCSILYLSGQRFMLRLKPGSDISYGIYLWGFPIQQSIAWLYPGQSIAFNQISSILIAAILGLASWHLIEKHGIKLGNNLGKRLTS